MSVRFLLDENVDVALRGALRRRVADLIVWAAGGPGTPPRGTPDPELPRWCEEHDFVLVTNNRRTMPAHLRTMPAHLIDHLRDGRHIPGIFQLSPEIGIGETSELLLLAADASRPDEHRDQMKYLPLL